MKLLYMLVELVKSLKYKVLVLNLFPYCWYTKPVAWLTMYSSANTVLV